jgi:histone H4
MPKIKKDGKKKLSEQPNIWKYYLKNGTLKKLARKAGIKRIAKTSYDTIRDQTVPLLENIVKDAITFTEHARQKTIKNKWMKHGINRTTGQTIYSEFQ